jgi:hypothetical protein
VFISFRPTSASTHDPNNIRSIINAHIQDPSIPLSAKNVDIVNSYTLWVTNKLQQYNIGLENGMDDMVSWWNDVFSGSATAVKVSSFLFR